MVANCVVFSVLGLWPDQERIIVSIGTGSAPGPDVTGDLKSLVDALKKIVTETEDTSNAFRKRNRRMVDEGYLYRFNVFHGLAEVGLAEHEAVGKISAHTATYLRRFDTAADIERCAKSLCDNGQRLGYIAGEGKSHTHPHTHIQHRDRESLILP